ncbi:MAG: SPFH/Band 7/PHB domain protein [Nitrosopumilus sp.]|nr:MAG: SPFH/Band 7/PHB domain protein [Nitrosopumilus sp.]
METPLIILIVVAIIGIIVILSGLKIIRPTHRAAVETLGKFSSFKKSGIIFVVPIIQRLFSVNITDTLVDVEKQFVITKDNLNCSVDAQIYYKVGEDEISLKKSLYSVNDYEYQIVQLAKTTLRSIIGDREFKVVNSDRTSLNQAVFDSMSVEAEKWGIRIVRVEVKEITPPPDVQDTMNMVIKAENDKQSAVNFAIATETKADGEKKANIKMAEGRREAMILEARGKKESQELIAEGEAKAIELVNKAANEFFIENAQILKKLQVTEESLKNNSKIIVTKDGIDPTLVINENNDTVMPISQKEKSRYRNQ